MKIMALHKVWRFPSTLLKHTGAFIIRGQMMMMMMMIQLSLPNTCHGFQRNLSNSI